MLHFVRLESLNQEAASMSIARQRWLQLSREFTAHNIVKLETRRFIAIYHACLVKQMRVHSAVKKEVRCHTWFAFFKL